MTATTSFFTNLSGSSNAISKSFVERLAANRSRQPSFDRHRLDRVELRVAAKRRPHVGQHLHRIGTLAEHQRLGGQDGQDTN